MWSRGEILPKALMVRLLRPVHLPWTAYDERKRRTSTTSPSRPSWTRPPAGTSTTATDGALGRRDWVVRLRRRARPRGAHRRRAGPGRAARPAPRRRPVAPSSRTSPRSSTASCASSGSCSSASGPTAPSRTPRTRWPSSRCSPRPPAPRCSRRSTSAARQPDPATYIGRGKVDGLARDRAGHRRRHRDLRRRARAQPAAEPRGPAQGQGRRPDRADPRHLRPAREVRGGPGAGRAGPAAAT